MTTALATKSVLHLGCGRKAKMAPAALLDYVGLQMYADDMAVTDLDADERLSPDLVCTLGRDPIPLPDNSVDMIVAWHVLEHIGTQGETDGWFLFWEEAYRVLKPNGWLYAECPYWDSIWVWSDPTHVRAMSEYSLIFFDQDAYRQRGSMISPYRLQCDFTFCGLGGLPKGWQVIQDQKDPQVRAIRFALSARKPFRPWWID